MHIEQDKTQKTDKRNVGEESTAMNYLHLSILLLILPLYIHVYTGMYSKVQKDRIPVSTFLCVAVYIYIYILASNLGLGQSEIGQVQSKIKRAIFQINLRLA